MTTHYRDTPPPGTYEARSRGCICAHDRVRPKCALHRRADWPRDLLERLERERFQCGSISKWKGD